MLLIAVPSAFNSFSWHTLLRPQTVRRMLLGLKYALWVGTAICVVLLFRELLDTFFSNALQNKIAQNFQSPIPVAESSSTQKDYSAITQRNVFGEIALPQVKATPIPTAGEKPRTTLALELIGIFIPTTKGERPYAIVENKKKNEQDVFSLNEMIFGEAKLVAVHPDRIDIERDGQVEVLTLDENAIVPVAGDGGVATVTQNEFVVEEAEVDKALENLPLLLQQARAVPYFRDGKADGLRLFAIRPDSLFAKIGLKNGDILKTVNAKSMADPSQALKLFEELKDERSITLVLERNRVTQEFKYEIR